jgi:hypothetical protein
MKALRVVGLLLMMCCYCTVDYAQENWNVTPVRIEACANYAGPVKIIGNTAVVQSTTDGHWEEVVGLGALDISNPANPQPLSGIATSFYKCCPEVLKRDSTLYFVGDRGVFWYSYSNPANPELLGYLHDVADYWSGQLIEAYREYNNHIYIGYLNERQDFIDGFEYTERRSSYRAYQLGIDGDIAPVGDMFFGSVLPPATLIVNGNHGLGLINPNTEYMLFDIGEDGAITNITMRSIPYQAIVSADIESSILATMTNYNYLVTYDATNLDSLVELSSISFAENEYENAVTYYIKVVNGIAYLCAGTHGLTIIDITDPTQPVLLSTTYLAGQTLNMDIVGTTLYLSTDNGLFILDVSNLQSPTVLGYYPAYRRLNRTIQQGNCLFMASKTGFSIFEITDDGQLIFQTHFQASLWGESREGYSIGILLGNYLAISDLNSGIRIIDVSHPANPTQVSVIPDSIQRRLIGIYDNVLLIEGGYIYLYDMTNPLEPVSLGCKTPTNRVMRTFMQGNYLYAAEASRDGESHGLEIFNFQDHIHLLSRGYVATSSYANDVEVSGDYAFIAEERHRFDVVDVCDHSQPIIISTLVLDGGATPISVTVDDGFAILCCGYSGFYVINVQNPAEPFIAGYYNTPGYAMSAEFDCPMVRLSDGYSVTLYDCSAAIDYVASSDAVVPAQKFVVGSNFPNPFNPSTTIFYTIPQAGHVQIEVYNVRGQMVRKLEDQDQTSGEHSVVWNGLDDIGKAQPSGVYFYRVSFNGQTEIRKMLLLK